MISFVAGLIEMMSPVVRWILRCVEDVIFDGFGGSLYYRNDTFDWWYWGRVVSFKIIVFVFLIVGVTAFIVEILVCSREGSDCCPFLVLVSSF